MPKAGKVVLLAATLALAATAVTLLNARREPYYQGRPLHYWIHEYSSLSFYSHEIPGARETATNAISGIGANAVPFLVDWVDYEPSPLRYWLTRARDKQRTRGLVLTGRSWIPIWMTASRELDRRWDAMVAFEVLGPAARSAIPRLSKLAHDPQVERSAAGFIALSGIGPEAIPELLQILNETNAPSQVRSGARRAVHQAALRAVLTGTAATNLAPLVPLILQNLTDKDQGTAAGAASVLGTLHLFPQRVVPALRAALHDPRPVVRDCAATALGAFGTDAQPAVPDLLALLNDPSGTVRNRATDAVRQIAPEVLTNPPAR